MCWNYRSASIAVIAFSKDVCDCGRLELVDFLLLEVMVVAFDLLVELCLEWIGVGCKQVMCWDVMRVVAYGIKDIAQLVVVSVDV